MIPFRKIIKKNIKTNILNLKKLEKKKYQEIISLISEKCIKTLKNNNKIMFCGNGGSAADSQHLCAELVSKFLKNRKPYAAVSLTTNTSTISSISNDFNYSYIFSKQIDAIGKEGDLLIAISTSGKSKNIIRAIKTSKRKKINSILLSGFKNKFKEADITFNVPANRVDRIQELHILIGHIICEIIEKNLN